MTAGGMGGSICVLGGGSWGTALARHLAVGGARVRLWAHEPEVVEAITNDHANPLFLPGFDLPPSLSATTSIEEACSGAEVTLVAVPSHFCRDVLGRARAPLGERPEVVVASKGIENGTLLRVSEIAAEILREARPRIAVLSGPSFAREVAAGRPTAIVAASAEPDLAARVQALLSFANLRVYTSGDPAGVELGGALKNVIAIAAGAVEGLGLGPNTLAALITRGLAEISRLAAALGGRRETLAGLSGLGDLVLTCTGALSRNRQVGIEIARGRSLEQIEAATRTVAEGIRTARAARDLGRRAGVEMPITEKVHEVLFEGKPAADAIRDLLGRPPRPERD